MNKFKVFGAVTALGLIVALSASAAEFKFAHERNDSNVSVPASETHKNLYAAGATVSIDGKTNGDLFAAGGMITINGSVEKDLFAAGGNLNINGTVGDDAHIAGGNISITGPIAGDLLVAGGNVTLSEKANVGADLLAAGGNLTIESEIKGKSDLRGGMITINGKVNGDLNVMANESLTFGPNSVVTGKITYEGPTEATVREGAKISVIEFTKTAKKNFGHDIGKLIAIATIIKLLGLFVAAWAVNRLFPGKFQSFANAANAKPWHYLGIGALTLIITPILGVLLMVTILGLYLGIALLAAYLLVLLVASFLAPYFVGSLLVAWYKKSSTLTLTWETLVYGLLAMAVIGMIPFIGWLAVGIVYTICLGALVVHVVKTETSINL